MAKKETYIAARDRLLSELPALFPPRGGERGYEAVRYSRGGFLKYPYLIFGRTYHGEPEHKLTFSAQAVHDEAGLSLWMDFRGMPAEEFDHLVREHYRS